MRRNPPQTIYLTDNTSQRIGKEFPSPRLGFASYKDINDDRGDDDNHNNKTNEVKKDTQHGETAQ
jgi:hypothetical protein